MDVILLPDNHGDSKGEEFSFYVSSVLPEALATVTLAWWDNNQLAASIPTCR